MLPQHPMKAMKEEVCVHYVLHLFPEVLCHYLEKSFSVESEGKGEEREVRE